MQTVALPLSWPNVRTWTFGTRIFYTMEILSVKKQAIVYIITKVEEPKAKQEKKEDVNIARDTEQRFY